MTFIWYNQEKPSKNQFSFVDWYKILRAEAAFKVDFKLQSTNRFLQHVKLLNKNITEIFSNRWSASFLGSPVDGSPLSGIPSSTEDIKPVIQVDKGRTCSNTLTHSPSPVPKALPAPEILTQSQQYSDFSRPSSLHISEDTKPVILPTNSSESVSCSASPHLKLPSTRSMHMDMRYSPYPRPPYSMSGMPSSFLSQHAHGHMYPSYSVPQVATYPSCQVGQSYPPCTVNQQSFGYPASVSSNNMLGLGSSTASSDLTSTMDLHGSADRTPVMEHRTT